MSVERDWRVSMIKYARPRKAWSLSPVRSTSVCAWLLTQKAAHASWEREAFFPKTFRLGAAYQFHMVLGLVPCLLWKDK